MKSNKLRRKMRRKFGIASPQPKYKQNPTPRAQQTQTTPAKGCCGRSK